MLNKIKTYFKSNKITLIISLILLILNIYFLINKKNNTKIINKFELKEKLVTNELDIWKNKYGNYVSESEVLTTDLKTLLEVYENQLDSITNQLEDIQKKNKNITELLRVKTVTSDSISIDIDKNNSFYYNDNWTSIYGTIFKDSLNLSYSINNDIDFVAFFKQKRFLNVLPYGRKTPYVQAVSYNPNTYVSDIKNVRIIEPKRKFSVNLSPQVGYGYTKYGFTPYAGVGMNINYNRY